MTLPELSALGLAAGFGLLLGAMGSGGSIVAVPVLVYVAGVPPHVAVGMSMAIVGVTSGLGAYLQWRRGHIHVKAWLLLGLTGMAGAYVGSMFTRQVDSATLMLLFASLLLGVGLLMLLGGMEDLPPGQCRPVRCASAGAVIGLLTGFLGVGGGFLLVPVLIVLAGVDSKTAAGTSLAIIAINSASGFAGQLRYVDFDGRLTFFFTLAAVAGMWIGLRLARGASEQTLRKAFATLLIVAGIVIGAMHL